ncbi:MAG TPA: DUF3488 and transglutaminase-like domain-containing protein [Mycobacteriales bacterium]|nr:DUF3488 and transglutaminase-like domain-containing protein [Mycobacteriales bacterium]
MTRQARRTLAAGFATTMALAALFPVYLGAHWFWRVFGAVAAVTLAGLLTRSARVPGFLQPIVAVVVLAAYLVVVFAHGTLDHGLLPTQATLDALRHLSDQGRADLNRYGPPVPPHPGLVLLTAAGVGAVAVLVDLLGVVLDRVAVAGLPLLALFAVPSAVLPGGLGAGAFAIGAIGWLVLLLEEGSDRVSRWGTPMRSALPGARAGGDDSSLGRVGRRIGAAALGLAVVVPALLPGLDHRLLGSSGGEGPGGDGPSSATTYNPLTTLQDQLSLPNPRQLFVYTTDDPEPDYVRMTTLDTYTGHGWASSKLEADRDEARVQKGIHRPAGETPSAPHQQVTMRVAMDGDHLQVHWLPVPYGPRKVDVEGTWLWDALSQTVFSASRTTQQLRPYTIKAERVLPSRDGLKASAGFPLEPQIQVRYGGGLPVTPDVAATAQRITAQATTPYDMAVALQRYFTDVNNGFVYDVNPSLPTRGEDPLEAFLAGKHGFCEQYATAMAAMLRVVGIPSRVAVGFTPGQKVPGRETADGTALYSVTTSDAHAWPEAWFPGWGWVRFEPTPAANGATTPDYTFTPTGGDPTTTPSEGPTPNPSNSAFPKGLRDPETLLRQSPSGAPLAGPVRHPLRWGLGGAAVLLVLLVPWGATAMRRHARVRRLDPHVAWAQLQDDVADVGGPWNAADSPGAAARRLTGLLDEPGRLALGRLATAAELARYAPAGRASSAGLVEDGTAVRRALLRSARRTVRWRAVLLAPSTLRWGSHLVAERVADLLDVSDRLLSALFKPARRLLRVRA